jgi:hypothetical protein
MKAPSILFIFLFMFFAGTGRNMPAGEKHNLEIEIKPTFGGQPLSISTATYLTSGGDTVSIDRFRFYISSVVVTFDNGEKYTEENSYHLIDAEDPSSLSISLKNIPAGKVSAILFNIGVDSTASVSGALSGALDPVKGMYWAWNSGYINAKLEGTCKTNKGKKNYAFEFHVGGYLQPYYALRSVNLGFSAEVKNKIVINADASAWLHNADLRRENTVVIPGKEAMLTADKYSKMFSIAN